MPSTELDDLLQMAEWITAKTAPVKYIVNSVRFGDGLVSMATVFKVERTTGEHCAPFKAIFTGTEERVRCFLNGILEGRCAALRRW